MRRAKTNLDELARQQGMTMNDYLLHLMHEHGSVTRAVQVIGCSIQTLSRRLLGRGWTKRGKTSDTVWIAPNGEVFEVPTRKQADAARRAREGAWRERLHGPSKDEEPDAALQIQVEDQGSVNGQIEVLIVDLLDNTLKRGWLTIRETQAMPETQRALELLAQELGITEQYTRTRIRWLRMHLAQEG